MIGLKLHFTKDDIDYFEGNPFFKAPCFDWVTVDNEVVVKNIIKLENLD